MARLVRFAALPPKPWANGLGLSRDVTREEGLYIGVADLGPAVAFSHFAGQDRVFTLIGGDGATLLFPGLPPLPCLPFVPAGFPGDMPCRYEPRGGAARAFNVIVPRGRPGPQVAVRSLAAGQEMAPPAGALALHCAAGTLRAGGERLEVGDTVLAPSSALVAEGAAIAILVSLG